MATYLGTRTYGAPAPMLYRRVRCALAQGMRVRFCLVRGGLAFYAVAR